MAAAGRRLDDVSPGQAATWAWDDLHETSPEAITEREAAARHEQEVLDAYIRGVEEGHAKGIEEARNELRHVLNTVTEALEQVRVDRETWEARWEERLVVLAAGMAQHVIERTRAEDDEVLIGLAREAVESFPLEEAIRIRVHPDDQAVLTGGGFVDDVLSGRTVRWMADEEVVRGGCVVEGPDRIVDGRIDETLARVVRVLTDG